MKNQIVVRPKIIPKIYDIWDTKKRYVVLYGGRGGAKSWGVAQMLILRAVDEPNSLFLCTREIQNTIADSVYRLLVDTIDRLSIGSYFELRKTEIKCVNGSRFIFKGLQRNINEIKSTEGIDYCWIEEANNISRTSWDVLVPTIRKENSQIFITFNPEDDDSPVYNDFVVNSHPDSEVVNINYPDNPYFPDVLRKEMEYDKQYNYEKYLHVWEGQIKQLTDACIFKGKFTIQNFETPNDVDFYFGADWGFSNDPTCLIRSFIKDGYLYIDYEAYGIGVELDEIEQLFDTIPASREYPIIGDNQRPDTISYLKRKGFHIRESKKGKGSIEDGIEFMRSFKQIIIHERCKNTIYEFKSYSYKKDRITDEILPIIVDKDNHTIDSIRYSLEKLRKGLQPIKASNVSAYSLGL